VTNDEGKINQQQKEDKMEERKSLRQLLIYHSPDGSLAGAASAMGLSRPTVSTACAGQPIGKHAAKIISAFVEGAYSVVELVGLGEEAEK
jgi:hypothetical protein